MMHSFGFFRYPSAPHGQFAILMAPQNLSGTDEAIAESPKMTRSSSLHFKTYLLVAVVMLFGPLGNVLVGKGLKTVGSLNSWASVALSHFFETAFTTPTTWLGIASLLTFFVAYIVVLS